MSFWEKAKPICELRAYVMGTIEDHTVGALDRFLKNIDLIRDASDAPAVAAALQEVENRAASYAQGMVEDYVPVLTQLKETQATLDNPCILVNVGSAFSDLNDAMDQLSADSAAGSFDAAHRVHALEAAGDAINAAAELMQATKVLAGFGDFLKEFVATAWKPLTGALGIKFRQIQWLDEGYVEGDGYLTPQPY